MIRIAFDIGGTFTDFVLHDDANGRTHVLKISSTADDPGVAVMAGARRRFWNRNGRFAIPITIFGFIPIPAI